jgi:hypothetical protein
LQSVSLISTVLVLVLGIMIKSASMQDKDKKATANDKYDSPPPWLMVCMCALTACVGAVLAVMKMIKKSKNETAARGALEVFRQKAMSHSAQKEFGYNRTGTRHAKICSRCKKGTIKIEREVCKLCGCADWETNDAPDVTQGEVQVRHLPEDAKEKEAVALNADEQARLEEMVMYRNAINRLTDVLFPRYGPFSLLSHVWCLACLFKFAFPLTYTDLVNGRFGWFRNDELHGRATTAHTQHVLQATQRRL